MKKLKKITILELRDKYHWGSGVISGEFKKRGKKITKQAVCHWFKGTPAKPDNLETLNSAIAFMGAEVIPWKKDLTV